MRPSLARPVFLDTTVLSNFASSNAIETLDDTLDSIAIVPAVREELEQGAAHGHEYLERALESIEADWTEVDVSREATKHQEIYERLDRGEAQALVGAISRGGTLATDDLAARRLASENAVDVTGSIGVLVLSVERGISTVETADEWLTTWEAERGYYAPIESIAELIE